MTATHTVREGEHLGTIAKKYGFVNFSVLWEHPENASLKELRKDPMLLAPGDKVFIPDRVQLIFQRATHDSYDFKVRRDKLSLILKFFDFGGTPRKNTPVALNVLAPDTGAASSGPPQTTDGDGSVSIDIATHVNTGTLELDGVELPLHIGALDPIETENGVAQRLRNLGYPVPASPKKEPQQMRLALEEFQADYGQKVTGERADVEPKLKEIYGG
ncbi:MAG TPA: LysM domain-containing protein [Polyangiaceae bacterium]|nr:LysM domain-containing protein [Polyangiaceae bacterium]